MQLARQKGGRGRLIGRTKGGITTKLHAIFDSQGRPLNLFVTAGEVTDHVGARALCDSLLDVDWLLGDRGYDADWFRETLKDKGIHACIPGRKQRKTPVKYDKRRYKRRNSPSRDIATHCTAEQRREIMLGRLKDWRRVATRYDRCPKVFLSAIALAATVIY
ncbi:IS5 family transposase [Litorisediminicola beolgyonensis]|uniref:IS5 family transposase n=1 Tax=Litorisediminicola beolgyonensis TaxID=1173614 RepID=A0ABW3ZPY8_9RHOB